MKYQARSRLLACRGSALTLLWTKYTTTSATTPPSPPRLARPSLNQRQSMNDIRDMSLYGPLSRSLMSLEQLDWTGLAWTGCPELVIQPSQRGPHQPSAWPKERKRKSGKFTQSVQRTEYVHSFPLAEVPMETIAGRPRMILPERSPRDPFYALRFCSAPRNVQGRKGTAPWYANKHALSCFMEESELR